MPLSVLPAFGLKTENVRIENFGSGLINNTWKITTPENSYILQRVNNAVFEEPANIAHNIRLIADYIHKNHPGYQFVSPLVSVQGDEMVFREGKGFYRLFPFVAGSHSKDIVENPEQAFEAAVQFGRFTKLLGGLDIKQMKITIPFFHDLNLRYEQFLQALEKGDKQRITECLKEIEAIVKHSDIVTEYKNICHNPDFRLRVTHHDTKISNVLFDLKGKGLCVIDLDTVMPGYFISDVGDMMRTYLSPVSEEEKDFSKIMVREEFYKAIVNGYFSEMKDELTATEKKYFFYAGEFIIYMQAMRFLTDHINDDKYYGAKYLGHNLVRAQNQLVLLQRLLEKESTLGNYKPE